MKLCRALLLLFALSAFCDEDTTELVTSAFEHFTRIECSSSGKSCVNPFCYLSQPGAANNSINFGCELQGQLDAVYVSFQEVRLRFFPLTFSFSVSWYHFWASRREFPADSRSVGKFLFRNLKLGGHASRRTPRDDLQRIDSTLPLQSN